MKESFYWARYTWALLHILCNNIKEEYFAEEIENIKRIIFGIFTNLPCPDCKQHATRFLHKSRDFRTIKNKPELINFIFNFHNIVNKRIGKRIRNSDILSQYNNIPLIYIANNWYKYFRIYHIDQYSIREECERTKFKQLLLNYLKAKHDRFI